jgi:hypothetical protein
VTVRRRVITTQQKGFRVDDPFYSDIEIMGIPSGLRGHLGLKPGTRGEVVWVGAA